MAEATGGSGGGGDGAPWSASFTWRIENFSKLRSDETVQSDCFEAGICTWQLRVVPDDWGSDQGTHLTVFLDVMDTMWATSVEYKFTLLNQADASKSRSLGSTQTFNATDFGWGTTVLLERSALRTAGAGWLVNDALVLTVNVSTKREDRFQLDTGDVPCDVTLKLTAPIPVDGSLGSWTYVLGYLYPEHDPPALTLSSVYTLLPVVQKCDFPKLFTRLMSFVKGKCAVLSHISEVPSTYIVRWLALSERLQLDELRELCLDRMQGMTHEQLQSAITVDSGSGTGTWKKYALRSEVKKLGRALFDELLTLLAVALPAGGGVVSASFLNAKPAVGGIGVEPRRGGVLRVLFTVASDAVADTAVRSRRNLRDVDPLAAVFDVLSDREEAQHRAQFHRTRLVVDGERGFGMDGGTHLTVSLEAQDNMWGPSAQYRITLVNQADASKSRSAGTTATFTANNAAWATLKFLKLSALKDAGAGWLKNEALVLTVDVAVQHEDRFQLNTGGIPCDMTLKLPCGAEVPASSPLLQAASPFFCDTLEDMKGSDPIPPELTLGSVYHLLPVVHKYDFPKLQARLVAFVKGKSAVLSHNSEVPSTNTVRWLALSERLQLDELRELCLDRLRSMSKGQRKVALIVEVEAGSGAGKKKKHTLRKEMTQLGQTLRDELFVLIVDAS
ncbi:hypothetical protein FOA52_003618 [Chlamydomonas sp. UWO 241]|nr:hypothetical protein FOA52_003618 [Chlamydomonas sp. UWO 241]